MKIEYEEMMAAVIFFCVLLILAVSLVSTARAEKRVYKKAPLSLEESTAKAYLMVQQGEYLEALEILDKLLSTEPHSTEIMFARAYVFEKSGNFWAAVEEYDRILKLSPENKSARKLREMALSDLGASSYALEEAVRYLPNDIKHHNSIEGDMAVDRINWKEYKKSIEILQPKLNDRENLRARYDYIIALVGDYEMKKAVELYEGMVEDKIAPPVWVLEHIASAYLYLEKPYEALRLYDEILKVNPDSFNSRMGKFYVLQELRKWERGSQVLDDLESDEPDYLLRGKERVPNWNKLDTALARGWFLVYEDRLKEAQEYFWDLHEKAPENTNIRSGLAHVYLWRGWLRKAIEEFRIIETIDPKDKKAQIGKISALNKLAFKEQAREEANELLKTHPTDKHVQDLVRQLQIEEMRELVTDFVISGDNDGFSETRGKVTLSQPISLYTRLYGFVLWQRASEDDQTSYFRRFGPGVDHIFNSTWRLRQQLSLNYDDGKDLGSFTQVNFTPDDYWDINLSYDSFTTDIPMRARVFDIEADKLNLDIAYVESDWRTYSLSLSRQRFSDNNERHQGMLGYEQGLWTRNNWKERIFIDLYTSRNSLDDAPYFNPDSDFSVSVTHLTEHTIKRIYRKAFVHRLYLSLGAYKQSGFLIKPIGSVRYEHDIDFSDAHSLLYGASMGSQAYDGKAVTDYSFYLTWRLLF